ncbi:MAG TPA: hypothetical protein VJI46_07685 [Candidatus Nanoarchaeia archaeon]|nr:hypothetical protein [Candidatus Nanoarchaeia archaeon]
MGGEYIRLGGDNIGIFASGLDDIVVYTPKGKAIPADVSKAELYNLTKKLSWVSIPSKRVRLIMLEGNPVWANGKYHPELKHLQGNTVAGVGDYTLEYLLEEDESIDTALEGIRSKGVTLRRISPV